MTHETVAHGAWDAALVRAIGVRLPCTPLARVVSVAEPQIFCRPRGYRERMGSGTVSPCAEGLRLRVPRWIPAETPTSSCGCFRSGPTASTPIIHVLVPAHADAEDIFQETSRTLWEKFAEYRPGPDAGFRTWALRIAQIEVLRYRQRAARRHRLFSDRLLGALDETVLAAIDTIDPRLAALGDCYRKLPDDDRLLIDARYRVGATVEAIAAETGRSVHSVYRALRRIHEALFECVEETCREEKEAQP
jgi:RNA polymerase sigma-70 factor, ECF subfamily